MEMFGLEMQEALLSSEDFLISTATENWISEKEGKDLVILHAEIALKIYPFCELAEREVGIRGAVILASWNEAKNNLSTDELWYLSKSVYVSGTLKALAQREYEIRKSNIRIVS